MIDTAQAPDSGNWIIALLLVLALGTCSLFSPLTFADDTPGDSQTEESDSDDDDDDDDDAEGSPGNKGKGKKDKGGEEEDLSDGGKPHCQKSAQYLFVACHHRAIADRWEKAADCENLLDGEARRSCFTEGKTLVNNAKRTCKVERDSRKDVCTDVGREAYEGWADNEFLGGDDEGVSIMGNDYFPLLPVSSVYMTAETTIEREVTDSTRVVDGVTCRIVVEQERLTDGDVLLERVERLYAQDIDDTVWTCSVMRQQYGVPGEGEDPMVISTHGSWEAGTDGAQAGIAMRWQPAFGDTDRRSYALGIDEELAEVIDPATVDSDFLCGGDCIILRITSPIGPAGYQDEYYEINIGLVHSEDQDGEADLDIQP